jgi:hypothetical protein
MEQLPSTEPSRSATMLARIVSEICKQPTVVRNSDRNDTKITRPASNGGRHSDYDKVSSNEPFIATQAAMDRRRAKET